MTPTGDVPPTGPPTDVGPAAGGSRERGQELMGRLSRILGATSATTLDVAVEECLEQVGRSHDADVAFTVLVDEEECITDDWRWVGPGVDVVPPASGSPLRDTFGSATELLRLGHTVAVDDLAGIELSPSERALADRNDLRSILVAPVRIGSTLLGVTGLQAVGEPHHWEAPVVAQMEVVAQLLLQAVQRTRDRGALAAADARARRIAAFIPDGLVLMTPVGHITWASPSFSRSTGLATRDLVGRVLIELVHPDDHGTVTVAMAQHALGAGVVARLRSADGWRWTDLSWQLMHDDDAAVPDEVVVSLRDVHEKHLRAEAMAAASRHDTLTGVLNRVGLDEALVALAERDEEILLAYVDIDGFKAVNDTAGHDAGDAVLRCVADALQSAVRATDHVARLGGDELCVVTACGLRAGRDAATLGQRLLDTVRVALAAVAPGVSVSLGVAGPGPATEGDALRGDADAAMYRAKRAGGDRYEPA